MIVDRIEGAFAVCELDDGTLKDIALSSLPKGIHEGSVIKITPAGSYIIDTAEEKERKEILFKLQDSLFDE